ncbi:MAG: hypothetical protein WCO26_07975 [Deltaproteobacteria bacterium]
MKKMALLLSGILVLVLLSFPATSLQAQTYPGHPIQLVIPMTPGDMTDLTGIVVLPKEDDVIPHESLEGFLQIQDHSFVGH